MIAEGYSAIAYLLKYPEELNEIRRRAELLASLLKKLKIKNAIDALVEFLRTSNLPRIQEEYVRAFDLSPLCFPYLSHHLFGDSFRRGAYMVKLKEIYREKGYNPPQKELPDHLGVVMEFLSYMASTKSYEERREIITNYIIDGLKQMWRRVENVNTPYKHLVYSSYTLCSVDIRRWYNA